MLLIPTLKRKRQAVPFELKARLIYGASSRIAKVIQNIHALKTKKYYKKIIDEALFLELSTTSCSYNKGTGKACGRGKNMNKMSIIGKFLRQK